MATTGSLRGAAAAAGGAAWVWAGAGVVAAGLAGVAGGVVAAGAGAVAGGAGLVVCAGVAGCWAATGPTIGPTNAAAAPHRTARRRRRKRGLMKGSDNEEAVAMATVGLPFTQGPLFQASTAAREAHLL